MNNLEKTTFLFAALISMMACNTEKPDETTAKTPVVIPYTASYSTSFEMGDPAFITTIVQGSWKDWEDNNLDNMNNWVADSILAYHSDQVMVSGKDSLIARWKRGRAMYTSSKPTIDAAMSVRATDKNENWVLVWATEIITKTDGTTDTVNIMETWRINKEGKADLLYQFDRAKRK
jgi:hypothetical protein